MSNGRTERWLERGLAAEIHYSVRDLAARWRYSPKTIRRIFRNEPGVIFWGRDETCHRRGYMTMTIPASVADRVHRRLERK